jgi:starch synthase
LFTIDKMEFWGKASFLKGGIVFSDYVTTVSKKYSREIQEVEYGFGLEGVLRARASTLTGILNGVDYTEWDPATDKFIARQYSPETLEGKAECKRDLLQLFGISNADPKLPVIGIVSRFAAQKGFDLIAEVADDLAKLPVIFTILGTGDKVYEELFRRLNRLLPQKFAVKVGYDNALAHRIEAGADMFLMPSYYEPSGLNQMYSLKYGTVPIVRATGGLDDTVEHWNPATGKGTGFKFSSYSGSALLAAVQEALQVYEDKPSWKKLMLNGMSKDFSWSCSAKEYVKVYERVALKTAAAREKPSGAARA